MYRPCRACSLGPRPAGSPAISKMPAKRAAPFSGGTHAAVPLCRRVLCNTSQLQTACRSRSRPAPPDAHSPSAFPAEWRHESTGEHAPSSRCAQPRVSGCNLGIRPSSDILGTRLRTPGHYIRPLFPCIRREEPAAGRLLRCGRPKGTNLALPHAAAL